MARTWFNTTDNAASEEDCKIMNRAARTYANENGLANLTYTQLSRIRNAYKPGMSARDVVDVVDRLDE